MTITRSENATSRPRTSTGKSDLAEMNKGDVLFFHCRLLHSAGQNRTGLTKFAAVFTYHADDNHPLPTTRSASLPEILLKS